MAGICNIADTENGKNTFQGFHMAADLLPAIDRYLFHNYHCRPQILQPIGVESKINTKHILVLVHKRQVINHDKNTIGQGSYWGPNPHQGDLGDPFNCTYHKNTG